MYLPNPIWISNAADRYGDIKALLKRHGTLIGLLDMEIAAHELAQGLILITHSIKHFDKVPRLKLEDWMTD